MKLSDMLKPEWTLVRDGDFQSLGLCSAVSGVPLLTFCGNQKYLTQALKNPDVSCIFVTPEMVEWESVRDSGKGICVVPKLRLDFFGLHNELCRNEWAVDYCGESFSTQIGEGTEISDRALVDSENVVIGKNCVIEPFVRIHGRVCIGDRCVIRSGTVLGGTGLEFMRFDGGVLPVDHVGKLVIEDDVEIQYNCNVSRSLFPWHETYIGSMTKIESLVHVAHGAHIGERCLIAASACIAGSAVLGDEVWVGPNATISSEVKIGKGARVNLGAVVASKVKNGDSVSGNFAMPHDSFLRAYLNDMRGE